MRWIDGRPYDDRPPWPEYMPAVCPACEGDRGWESQPYGVDYRDGSVLTDWIVCQECEGSGESEEAVEPVECDDDFEAMEALR